jgi:hypothetical protein
MRITIRVLDENLVRKKAKEDFETFISWMLDADVYTIEDDWSDNTLEILEFADEDEQKLIQQKIINGQI